MKIHWYWPFARPEELHWAEATCSEGEELVVQVIDREAAPTGGPWGQHLRVERNYPMSTALRSVVPSGWRLG